MRLPRAALAVVATVGVMVAAACGGGDPAPQQSATTPTQAPATSPVTPRTTSTSSTSSTPGTTSSTSSATSSTTTSTSAAATIAGPTDPLTGEKLSDNPVIAAKIENTHAGMPQYGVADADVIYTQQVEGGLVRLIAIFHTVLPEEVGAVRSVRSTDVQLLPSFGAPILVYSGGATAQLKRLRNSDLIATTEGDAGFWRSNVKKAPYNLHANLQQVAAQYPDKAKAQSAGFEFSLHDDRLRDAERVSQIAVTMHNGNTSFRWVNGRYQAYFSGEPYLDAVGSKHVFVDNVVVQNVDNTVRDGTIDPAGNPSYLTKTVGEGTFTLYRDGRKITGTWHRADVSDPTQFLDASGDPVPFKPGKTWVLLAPGGSAVSAH